MFELNGKPYSKQDLQTAATKYGMDFDSYLETMKKKGLVEKTNGSAGVTPTGGPVNTGSKSGGGSSAQPEIEARKRQNKTDETVKKGLTAAYSDAFGIPKFMVPAISGASAFMTGLVGNVTSLVEKGYESSVQGMTKEEMLKDGKNNLSRSLGEMTDFLNMLGVEKYDELTGETEDLYGLVEDGRYADAGELLAFQAFSSAPALAITAAAPMLGSMVLGASTAGESFEESLKNRPDETLEDIWKNSLMKGAAEWGTEWAGGKLFRVINNLDPSKKTAKTVADLSMSFGKNILKKAGLGFLGEGITEGLTDTFQQGADQLIFGDVKTAQNYIRGFINAAAVGAVMGGGVSGGGRATQGNNKNKLYHFISPKQWQIEQQKIARQIDNNAKDLKVAKENNDQEQIDLFQNNQKKLIEAANKNKTDLYTKFDNKSRTELINYAKNMDIANKALNIIGNNKYSEQAQAQAENVSRKAYQNMFDSIGNVDLDVDVEQSIGEALKASEILDPILKKAKGINREDLTIKILNTQEEIDAIAKKEGSGIKSSDGAFLAKGKDGKATIYINKKVAAAAGATNVVGHELLHYMISRKFKTDNKSMEPLIGELKTYLKDNHKDVFVRVQERIDKFYTDKNGDIKEGALEEYLTVFSDLISKQKIDLKEDGSKGLKSGLTDIVAGFGFGEIKLDSARDVIGFLSTYNKNINRKGLLGKLMGAKILDIGLTSEKLTKGETKGTEKKSKTRGKLVDDISDLQQGATTKADFQKPGTFNKVFEAIQPGGAINNYIRSLGMSKEKTQETIDAVTDRLINFDPEAKRKDGTTIGSKGLGEFIMANVGFGKLVAAEKLFKKGEKAKRETSIDTEEAKQVADKPTTKVSKEGPKARVLKSLADVNLDNKNIISATARAEINALIEQNPKNLEQQITKLIEKEITKAVKAQMGKISNVKGEVVISDEYKAFIALNYENIVQSWDVNTIKNNYKTLFELTEIGKEDRKTRKSDKPSLKKDSNYRKGIFKIETNKAKFTKFFTEGGYTTLLARQKGLANQIAKGITEDVINNEIIENSNDINTVIKAEVADYGNRLNKQKNEVVGNYADQIKFSKTAATKHALDQIFLVEEISKKGYNKVFNNKGELFSKYKSRKIDIDSIDFVNELHDKGLIIPSEAMNSIQSKAYSKALSLVVQKVGAKSRANTYEWVPINIALEIGGKYGLEMLTPRPAEGGLPDFHSTLHGFDFFVEGKLYDAQHGSVTIGEANLTTGKMKILNDYKINPVLQEMWDSKIKELKDYASLVVDLMKEKGIKISELKNNTPIPAEIFMQAGRQMYNIQKNTTARKFMPGKAFDIVSELYNNKKLPDGTPVPNYYINILGKGLRWLGDNIYNLPVPKFEGDINMAMRAVAASSTPVKAPKGYEAFHKPGMKYYALNMRFIPTVDMKSVKGESKYSIDNKAEMIALLKTDAVLEMKRKREKINGSKFSKSVNKARTIDYSKSSKGITVLDFDDTLATTKSLVKFTRPDGTTGTLNAEEYASTYEDLLDQGFTFDFSDFNKVVKGKLAPLFQKALKLQSKFGPENMFILTARPIDAQKAIFDFLKANGLNIPIKNITGLGNSTAEAKALWIADKVGEGFNDFYFADDALQNTQAVKNMLDQFDVKSKVQQAKVKFSKSMNNDFNDILENVTDIDSKKRFSAIKARKRGDSKGKFRFFIPPSHEDFVGLLYNFMGKGKEGNAHRDFFEKALVRPLNRAYRELNTAKQSIANDFKSLNKQFKDVSKKLAKKTPDGDFTYQDAIRTYLWNKHGHKVPGLSPTDQQKLVDLVMNDSELQTYAETLNVISKQEAYVKPTESWEVGDIRTDLDDATGRIGREQYFAEFKENADIIFSEENLNKIEAAYGKDVRSALEDSLYRTKTGRNRPSGQNKLTNRFLNYLNGSVASTMFVNVRSALLQQMSIVNFINYGDNNVLMAAKAFANLPQYFADWAMIFNSDFMKQRRGGIKTDVNGAELAASLKGAKNTPRALLGKLLELGFLPTQIGDNFAIATGGAPFYRNRVNTYLKQGLSKKEAETKAWIDFQGLAEATQQSARPDMVSQQQASPLGKIILAFQNVTSQFNRLGKKAFLDIKNRRITPGNPTQLQSDMSNVSRIAYYFAIQNVVFYSLQTALFAMMFDDDEDDEKLLKKKERVINGSIDSVLRGTGVMGAVIATLKNMAIKFAEQREKGYNADESAVLMEALNVSPPLGIKARKLVNAEKTLNYNKKVIDEMETFDLDNPIWSATTNIIEATTNAPLNRMYNKTVNTRNALDNDYTAFQRSMFISGYTTWSLDLGDTKKMQEIKDSIKAKKKNKTKKLPKLKGGFKLKKPKTFKL